MNGYKFVVLSLFVFFILPVSAAVAQDSTTAELTYIELKDGSTFNGYVLEENEEKDGIDLFHPCSYRCLRIGTLQDLCQQVRLFLHSLTDFSVQPLG